MILFLYKCEQLSFFILNDVLAVVQHGWGSAVRAEQSVSNCVGFTGCCLWLLRLLNAPDQSLAH